MIDEQLGRRLQSWAGMRNVLVHLYLDIDHGMTWDAIRNDLGDLRRLAQIVHEEVTSACSERALKKG